MVPRVDVVDAVNPRRLLGTIPRPAGVCDKYEWHWAICDYGGRSLLIPPPGCLEPEIVNVRHVQMTAAWQTDEGNWTQRRVLYTYAPLSDLMLLHEFRLPGETDADWHRRRW